MRPLLHLPKPPNSDHLWAVSLDLESLHDSAHTPTPFLPHPAKRVKVGGFFYTVRRDPKESKYLDSQEQ